MGMWLLYLFRFTFLLLFFRIKILRETAATSSPLMGKKKLVWIASEEVKKDEEDMMWYSIAASGKRGKVSATLNGWRRDDNDSWGVGGVLVIYSLVQISIGEKDFFHFSSIPFHTIEKYGEIIIFLLLAGINFSDISQIETQCCCCCCCWSVVERGRRKKGKMKSFCAVKNCERKGKQNDWSWCLRYRKSWRAGKVLLLKGGNWKIGFWIFGQWLVQHMSERNFCLIL